MAYKITDACVNCGSCEGECPVGAISESGDKRVIDAATCVSCGTCAGVCPAEAIVEEQSSIKDSVGRFFENAIVRFPGTCFLFNSVYDTENINRLRTAFFNNY